MRDTIAETAGVLAGLIKGLRGGLGRRVKILEIGAHEGESTAKIINEMIQKHGLNPNDIDYYCQDALHVPQPLSFKILKPVNFPEPNRVKVLEPFDASSLSNELDEHKPFDIILSKNVKVIGGIDPHSLERGEDPARAKKIQEEILRLHENSYKLLHDHGFMVDVIELGKEEGGYVDPPKEKWAIERPGKEVKVYRKKELK